MLRIRRQHLRQRPTCRLRSLQFGDRLEQVGAGDCNCPSHCSFRGAIYSYGASWPTLQLSAEANYDPANAGMTWTVSCFDLTLRSVCADVHDQRCSGHLYRAWLSYIG
jgi:hypothetical protein